VSDEPWLLMNPGPTNVSERVRESLLTPDMSHRHESFRTTLRESHLQLLTLLNGAEAHEAATFVCSGTGANEALIGAIAGKLAVLVNGRYSRRLVDIASRLGVSCLPIEIDELDFPSLEEIERILRRDAEVTHLFVVHVETTTGVRAPLRDIGRMCRELRLALYVDAISSVGGHEFDLELDNVAACSITPNKCVEGLPGIAIVVVRKTELNAMRAQSRSLYLDVRAQIERARRGSVPYTAAVQIVFAFRRAVELWEREGVPARIARYARQRAELKARLLDVGLAVHEPRDDLRSNIIVLVRRPNNVDYQSLADYLKRQKIEIYSPEAALNHDLMLFAAMGQLSTNALDRFRGALAGALERAGTRVSAA
jgi:2-aminoethylphosphonate-pyruvate transaminase